MLSWAVLRGDSDQFFPLENSADFFKATAYLALRESYLSEAMDIGKFFTSFLQQDYCFFKPEAALK